MNILAVRHQLVNNAVRCDFNDAITHCIEDLKIMARENHIACEVFHAVVEGSDGFKVKVIRWLV